MKDERKRILKMVEDGKLTVEAALAMLEELEKKSTNDTKSSSNDTFTFTNEEQHKSDHYKDYETESTTDKIISFVDTAIKRVRNFDLDFNFGKYETVNHIFQQADGQIDEIDVDIANGSITVIPWEQTDIRVECEAKVYRAPNVSEARKQFLEETQFTTRDNKLQFILQEKLMKAHIVCYVPQTELRSVQLRLFNGPITVKNAHAYKIDAKTANGKLLLQAVTCEKSELETANGTITVENSIVNNFDGETINGKISLIGDFYKINAKTLNGNIEALLKGGRCKYVDVKAITGASNIYLSEELLQSAIYGQLKTNLGSLKVELPKLEILEEKNEFAQKKLQFRTATTNEKHLHIFSDTKTGSITLKKESYF